MNRKPLTRICPVIAICESLLFCKLTEAGTTVSIGIFDVDSFTRSQVRRLVNWDLLTFHYIGNHKNPQAMATPL
jgi:hypothetical protein